MSQEPKFFTAFSIVDGVHTPNSKAEWVAYWDALTWEEKQSIVRKSRYEDITKLECAVLYGALENP